jgi:UDP-4-amino-4,6-dideoxy-N-acetyl-beta-L-altrosamine N-acetyltransferase
MNEITKYGIKFVRLNESHLEMVREWRNSDDVRLFMQYQKIITKEEQIKWFNRINNDNNFYFVSYHNDKAYGLYNVKDIDYTKKSGEAGVFLKSNEFSESDLSMRGTFLLFHIIFNTLHLDLIFAHVLKSNVKVLNYNVQLGFVINSIFSNEISYYLDLSKDDFYNKRNENLIKYIETR